MLKELGASLLMDLIGTVKTEKDFFSGNADARKKALESRCGESYPKAFVQYMAEVEKGQFMKEVQEAVEVFGGSARPNPKNALLKSVSQYICEDFAKGFDSLTLSFFFEGLAEREKALRSLFPGSSALSRNMRDRLLRGTYQEIGQAAYDALCKIGETPAIVIQSPIELPPKPKEQIRSYIVQKYPHSFAEFQVNPQIIGGMRVFISGKVVDNSWLSRIQALSRISL